MILSRRRFWSYAAPAIVLAPSLMKVSTAAMAEGFKALKWEHLPSVSDLLYGDQSHIRGGLSELITATLRNRSSKLAQNVTMNNAILRWAASGKELRAGDLMAGQTVTIQFFPSLNAV